jgi:hypothetical protein
MKNTYCSKTWTDINIDFENRTVRHCCKTTPYDFPDKLTEDFISNNERIQERRRVSMLGEEHADCSPCWEDYEKGKSAYRDWANRWTDEYIQSHNINVSDEFINYIEIKPDRICDMSCLYCSDYSSSKIAQEEGVIYLDKTDDNDYDVFKKWIKTFLSRKDLIYQQVVFIFLGGEPTASSRFYYLTEYIEEQALLNPNLKIRLEICTNCNSKPFLMDKIINKMDQSRLDWAIGISNESFGDDAELIRWGLDWSRFENNFVRYITHPKTELIVLSPTINILNLKSFPRYIEWVFDQFKHHEPKKEFSWYGNFINWPECLDISVLPASYLKYLEEAEAVLNKNKSTKNWLYQENFFSFIKQMKIRINQAHDPDYKEKAKNFLIEKQLKKKTDRLINLLDNLDL